MSFESITTFEQACKARNYDPQSLPDVSNSPEHLRKYLIAAHKLAIIAEALNEGWTPDWENRSQYKYFPWFTYKSGFGFSCTSYDIWCTLTLTGSRLCYKSSEVAIYAGEQFETIYNDFLTF